MRQYIGMLNFIMNRGFDKSDRTGTGTKSVFVYQMQFDLGAGFPLLTTKRIHFKSVVAELLWFLSGSTNNNDLRAMGCTIWDEWAREDGALGPIYGKQWRKCAYDPMAGAVVDQISKAVHLLRTDPDSRRNVVSAWNVAELSQMALEPCHLMFQLYTRLLSLEERANLCRDQHGRELHAEDVDTADLTALGVPERVLSLHMYQRSADAFLGVPFNIASYALLTHMFAREAGMLPGILTISYGDLHIYSNHMEQVALQRRHEPLPHPTLVLDPKVTRMLDFRPEHISLRDYQSHESIKAPVAV